jgi:rubrerythrin
VPESAVLRSGARNTAFVALADGKFEGRDVTLGVEAENAMIEVTRGLNAGERVVTSGQFLLDSESQLREAIEKMRGTTSGVDPGSTRVSSTNGISTVPPSTSNLESLVYVCPMPEHVSIIYDHAGSCPICGMALVPVMTSVLQKIQPGGKVLYYTCPMPEHANVHEEKPGKCPLCAMTLIPVMAQPGMPVKIDSPAPAKPLPKLRYYCPMHPEVISNGPGKCPKCEMDLVPMPESAK